MVRRWLWSWVVGGRWGESGGGLVGDEIGVVEGGSLHEYGVDVGEWCTCD